MLVINRILSAPRAGTGSNLKSILPATLLLGLALVLGGCGDSQDADDAGLAAAQRLSMAVPFDLAAHIGGVRFEVTDGAGNTESAVVPLVAQGLPGEVDPALEGHSFADWFVALRPGTYDILAVPLDNDEAPSELCTPAAGTATVFAGVTTEIVLVSNCDTQRGGLDIALVFNHVPHITQLVISPNKFLCIGRQVTLSARAHDADGDEIGYDWQVSATPAGVDSSDYQLPVGSPPWQAEFSANLPGLYELTLSVSDGFGSSSLTFPIYVSRCDAPQGGSVHGVKWQDNNGDGLRDDDEPGLPGVTIYSDTNRNAALDPGEPRVVSMADDPDTDFDESGRYWLEHLPPGRHSIREVVPEGFVQTFPIGSLDPIDAVDPGFGVTITPETINATLAAGETLETPVSIGFEFFCFRPYEIDVDAPAAPAGMLENLSGVQLNGCGGDVSEFTIRLTGDGTARDFELRFVDAEFGGVLGIIPVRIMAPDAGAHEVLLESGGTLEGLDFGNRTRRDTATVSGRKWLDSNGNGRRDNNEPGLAGVVIYSDLNSSGELDRDEPRTVSLQDDPRTDFDEAGLYWLEGLRPGTHAIREVVPDGFVQTFPILPPVTGVSGGGFDTTPDALNLTIAAGTTLDTQVALTIEPLCVRPFEIALSAETAPAGAFQNLSGESINSCGGDTSSFDIRLAHAGGVVDFAIDFVDAEFGGILGSIPVRIGEPGSGFHAVRLVAGASLDGLDFGNARK